jgi:hypothetical protein
MIRAIVIQILLSRNNKVPLSDRKGESETHGAVERCKSIAIRLVAPHLNDMVNKSPLDDPEKAAHAWAHYRRIMRLLMGVTIGVVLIAMALLYTREGAISVHFYIAVALGISFTMLLGGGLMGLVFLSNGTGHDEAVDNRLPEADELFGRDNPED